MMSDVKYRCVESKFDNLTPFSTEFAEHSRGVTIIRSVLLGGMAHQLQSRAKLEKTEAARA